MAVRVDAAVASCCTSPRVAVTARSTISAASGHSEQRTGPNRQPPPSAHGRQGKTDACHGEHPRWRASAITNHAGAVCDRALSIID